MSLSIALVAILLVALAAGWLAYSRARRLRASGRLHSLPSYHGSYAMLWAAIPALLLLAAWAPIQSRLVEQAVLASPEGKALPEFDMQRQSILSEARQIAHGEREQGFNAQSATVAPIIRDAEEQYALIGGGVAILAALAAGVLAFRRCAPQFRARTGVERWIMIVLFAASLIAILTTLGILLSLMFESLRFFRLYPVTVLPVRDGMEPANRAAGRPGGIVGGIRLHSIVVGNLLHRGDHRHDRRHSAGADERDLSHPICGARRSVVAEAHPGDPRRRADRRVRLFRRPDRGAGRTGFWAVDRHRLGQQRERARGGPGDGDHDHPLHQLDGGRFDRRRASGNARR